jgi:hypothetical protein
MRLVSQRPARYRHVIRSFIQLARQEIAISLSLSSVGVHLIYPPTIISYATKALGHGSAPDIVFVGGPTRPLKAAECIPRGVPFGKDSQA